MTEAMLLVDDGSIVDSQILYRRISRVFVNWALAEGDVPPIPSQGFQDQNEQVARETFRLAGPCMSIGIELVLLGHNETPAALIEGMNGDGVVQLEAGQVRGLKSADGADWSHGIMANPTPEAPWHGVAFTASGRKRTGGMQSALARLARWVILPKPPA